MSNGALSLEASVRTCSVNVGEANRIQSDRFFNPTNMVCIPWNGVNNKGQEVCPDSFWTKTAGCNSAEDRVMVENGLRPKYMNYVTLSASGINGGIYGNKSAWNEANSRQKMIGNITADKKFGTGQFGNDFGASVQYTGCTIGSYERNQAQMAEAYRNQNALQNGYIANSYRNASGGY